MTKMDKKMTQVPVRVLTYRPEQIYKRPELVRRLKFLTNGGWGRHPIGSGMLNDLNNERKALFIIAWHKARVVGWGNVHIGPCGLQVSVYVERKFRRLGIGTKILQKAKRFSRQAGKDLVSSGWNHAGRKFYEKNKVEKVGFFDWSYTRDIPSFYLNEEGK